MTIKMKGAALAAVCLGLAGAACAATGNYSAAGCGLGSMLFQGKNGKVHLILAATTNGSFGSQTFGISSDTLGCSSEGVVKAGSRVEAYAEANLGDLSRDIARGGGETLAGLATLMGARDASSRALFYRKAQSQYERLFPAGGTTPSQFVAALRTL